MEEDFFDDIEELVTSEVEPKNYKGIVLALFTIAAIGGLIITSIVIVTPRPEDPTYGDFIQMEEALVIDKTIHKMRYTWRGDNLFFILANGSASMVNTNQEKLKPRLLLTPNKLLQRGVNSTNIVPSEDLEAFLVAYDTQRIGQAEVSRYKIFYSTKGGVLSAVNVDPLGEGHNTPLINQAKWGPRKKYLSVVMRGDLYYSYDPIEVNTFRCVSCREKRGLIYAVAHWMYPTAGIETPRDSGDGHWWNSNGQFIALTSLDETEVSRYSLPIYGPATTLYTSSNEVPYSKAGQKGKKGRISQTSVLLANLQTKTIFQAVKPEALKAMEHYVSFVKWFNDSSVLIGYLDRTQRQGWITYCDVLNQNCIVVWQNEVETGFLKLFKQDLKEPICDPPNSRFFTVLPANERGANTYRHIAQIRIQPLRRNQMIWLTSGSVDVKDIVHYIPNTALYFVTSYPKLSEVQLYTVSLTERSINCVSCDDPNCTTSQFSFGTTGRHYLQECLGPQPPTYGLRLTQKPTSSEDVSDNKWSLLLENNTAFKQRFSELELPIVEFITLELPSGSFVPAKVFYPPELNKEHITQYPLLLLLGDSFDSPTVSTQFDFGWHVFLTTTQGIICIRIDPLSLPSTSSSKALFDYQVRQYIEAIRKYADFQFVHPDRIGVFGQFHGGFDAINILGHQKNTDIFRCGVAISPITDYSYFESQFSEKYLGKFKGNELRYSTTNSSKIAQNLIYTGLLLVHGTADQKSHFQNSAQLIKYMVDAGVTFDLMIYPDEDENLLKTQRIRRHLLLRVTKHLLNCYRRTSKRWPVPMVDLFIEDEE